MNPKAHASRKLQDARQEIAYSTFVEQLSQRLMNDWDNRSAMGNPLPPLA